MARKPARLGYDEAAALPYGAITALHFLRRLGAVEAGEKVLILGASGGVGRFAVQVAKHLGAEVTGVCSTGNFELVRSLGADHVIDHRSLDLARLPGRYDVIFDIAGVTTFAQSRSALSPEGRFLTLLMSFGVLVQMLATSLRRGPRAIFSIAAGDRSQMEQVAELAERGDHRIAHLGNIAQGSFLGMDDAGKTAKTLQQLLRQRLYIAARAGREQD